MATKKPRLELKVVFDTSALYTRAASDLVAPKIKELIQTHSAHPDLVITWLLPGPVIEERRFQMQKAACELLPAIEKLERLLGHALNINKTTLAHRIDQAITVQIESLGAAQLALDTNEVDWASIVRRSLARRPPFEDGETEKGFKDAIIAECFLQLTEKSAKTPSVCRLAFVSEDQNLSDYIRDATQERKNVRVLSASELESLINTLVSEVTEEFVTEMVTKAAQLFFEKDNSQSLYYHGKVADRIKADFGNELKTVPSPTMKREPVRWTIAKPVFVKKHGTRLFWNSLVTTEDKLSAIPNRSAGLSMADLASRNQNEPSQALRTLADLITRQTKPAENADLGIAKTAFEVHWTVRVTSKKRLVGPSVTDIRFLDTKFAERQWGLPMPPSSSP